MTDHRYSGTTFLKGRKMDVYERMTRYGFADMSPGPRPTEPFVVKVQRPPTVTKNMPDHFLVYSEDRSVRFLLLPKTQPKLTEAMDDRRTAYFWAEWQHGDNVHINTQKPVDDGVHW